MTPLSAGTLLLLLPFVATTTLEKHDECQEHTTCASCAGARYDHRSHQWSSSLSSRYLRNGDDSVDDENEDFQGIFHRRPTCLWCPYDNTCSSKKSKKSCGPPDLGSSSSFSSSSSTTHIHYEYDCPLSPTPYPNDPPTLLPNWMGTFLQQTNSAFGQLTLLDISLPGTHDSLSYDLSLTVSDDGLNEMTRLAKMLHTLSGGKVKLLPGEMEEFFRLQAKTQQLSITEQLDNGIRFVDLRLMMERNKEWYSIHMMQSKQTVPHYLQQIRDWLNAHPNEIIVIWLSKHGSTSDTGQDQYPKVSIQEKQAMWSTYSTIFDGLLIDTQTSSLDQTAIQNLIQRNHRVITFVSDYVEFTDSSQYALDGKLIENYYVNNGAGVFDEIKTLQKQKEYFSKAGMANRNAKKKGRFTLMSMNTSSPSWQVVDAAKNRFLPRWLEEEESLTGLFKSCASKTNIPGIKNWCPETLLDLAQLSSYYNQISFEEAFQQHSSSSSSSGATMMHAGEGMLSDDASPASVAFPHAFYLDALDYDGTIRTGTQVLFGSERADADAPHKHTKFAYVDTVLAYNLNVACKKINNIVDAEERGDDRDGDGRSQREAKEGQCSALKELVERRRAKYPMKLWNEEEYGRHEDWPPSSAMGS